MAKSIFDEVISVTPTGSIFDSIIPVTAEEEQIEEEPVAQTLQEEQPQQITQTQEDPARDEVAKQIADALAAKRAGKEPTTVDKYSAAVKKGFEGAMLGWDFLASKTEEFFTGGTKDTADILAKQAAEYTQLESDPRVAEAMELTSEEYKASGEGIKGGYAGLKKMLGYFIDNPEAAGLFLSEQVPGFALTAPVGGVPGTIVKSGAAKFGVSAAKQRGLQTATTGATINSLAVVGNALGPNYAEGLRKFDGDVEQAKEYATTKTLNEIPANFISGLFIGLNPVTRMLPGAPKFAQVAGDVSAQAVIQGAGGGIGAKQAAESVGEDISFGELGLEMVGGAFTTPLDIATELAFRPVDQGVESITKDTTNVLSPEEEQQILASFETPVEPAAEAATTPERRRVFPPTGDRARPRVFPPSAEEVKAETATPSTTPEGQMEFDFGEQQAELFSGVDPNIPAEETATTDVAETGEIARPTLPNPDQLQLDFSRPLTDKLAEGIINQTSLLVDNYSPLEAETIYGRAVELIDEGVNPAAAFKKATREFDTGKLKVDTEFTAESQLELPFPKKRGRPSTVDKRARDIEKTRQRLEKKVPLPAIIRSRKMPTEQKSFDFVLRELEKVPAQRDKKATLDEVQSSMERKLNPAQLRRVMDESFKLLGQYQDAEAFAIYEKARELINEGATPVKGFKQARDAYKNGELSVTRDGEPRQLDLPLRLKRKTDKQPERPRSTLLAPEQLSLDLDRPEGPAPQQLEMPLRQRKVVFPPGEVEPRPDAPAPQVARRKKKEPVTVAQARKTAEKIAKDKKGFEDVNVLDDTPDWVKQVDKLLNTNTEVSEQTAGILGDPTITNGSLIKRLLLAPTTRTVEEFARRKGLGNYVDKINNILARATEKTSKMRYKADMLVQQLSAFMFDNPVAARKFNELVSLAGEQQFDVAKYKTYDEAVKNDKVLKQFTNELNDKETSPEAAAELRESIRNRKNALRDIYRLWSELGNLKRRPSIFFPRGVFRRGKMPEGHELFIKLRDMYKSMLAEQRRVDLANIEKLGVSEDTKTLLRSAVLTKYAQLDEADFYSPNMRFGERYVRVSEGDQSGLYTFSRELLKQATPGVTDSRQKFINEVIADLQAKGDRRTAEELIADGVITFGDSLDELRKDASGQDVAISQVFNILDKINSDLDVNANDKDIVDQLRDSITQVYLDSLPSVDIRKRMMRRRNVRGYDKDPLRALAVYMQHASAQIPRREFSPDLRIAYEEAMENFGVGRPDAEVMKAYIDELNERASIAMTPENVPELLRTVENFGAGSVFFTALTGPASAIQNLFTLVTLGLSVYGNKYGYAKVLSKFTNYLALFGSGKGDLLPDGFDSSSLNIEQDGDSVPLFLSIRNSPFVKNDPIRRAAMDVAANREVIQQNFFTELTATSNVPSSERLSGRFKSIVPRIKLATETTLRAIAFPFKMTEKLVREIMYLSAFDFEFEANFPRLLEKYRKEVRPGDILSTEREMLAAEQRAYNEAFKMSVDRAIDVLNEGAFNYSRHNRAANKLMSKGDIGGAAVRNMSRLQSYRIQAYDFMIRNALLAFKEGVQFEGQDKGRRRKDAFVKLLTSMGFTALMGGIRATAIYGPVLGAIGAALNSMDWAKELLKIEDDEEDPSLRKATLLFKHSYEQWFATEAVPQFFSPDTQYVQNITVELNKLRDKDNQLTATQVSEFLRLAVMRGVPGAATNIDISPQLDLNIGNIFNNPYERGGGKLIDPTAITGIAGDIATKVADASKAAFQAVTEERNFAKAMEHFADALSDIPTATRNIKKMNELEEKGRVDRRTGAIILPADQVTRKEKIARGVGYGMTKENEAALNMLKNQRVAEKLIDRKKALLADIEEDLEKIFIGKDKDAYTSYKRNIERKDKFNKSVFDIEDYAITDEDIDKKIETILEEMVVNGQELYLPPTKGMSKGQRDILERAQERYYALTN